MSHSAEPRLDKLPTELRLQIFEYLLQLEHGADANAELGLSPQILSTCKKFYNEGQDILDKTLKSIDMLQISFDQNFISIRYGNGGTQTLTTREIIPEWQPRITHASRMQVYIQPNAVACYELWDPLDDILIALHAAIEKADRTKTLHVRIHLPWTFDDPPGEVYWSRVPSRGIPLPLNQSWYRDRNGEYHYYNICSLSAQYVKLS